MTLLAAGLRGYQARESLWVDELHTSWTVSGGLGQVSARAKQGNQSPHYFYLSWVVTRVLGTSEMALRLPSLLAGIGLVPLVYVLVRSWTSSWGAALFAALLAAIDPALINFSQEARPYALVQLVGLAQIAAFWKLTAASTSPERRRDTAQGGWQAGARLAFILCTALLIGLHYTAALLVLAELAYFGFLTWGRRMSAGYSWLDLCFDLFVAGFICLPMVPHMRDVFERRQLWRAFVDAVPRPDILRMAAVYLALPLAVVIGVGLVRRAVRRTPALARIDVRVAALVACWIAAPTLAAWLATYFNLAPIFFPRWLIVSAIALPIAAGLMLAALPTRLMQGLLALGVLATALHTSGMIDQFRADRRLVAERNEDWRGAVQYISAEGETGPVLVLLCPGLIEDELLRQSPSDELRNYCRFPVKGGSYWLEQVVIPLTTNSPVVPAADDLPAVATILPVQGAWVMVRGTRETAERVVNDILATFDSDGARLRIDDWQAFGDLYVIRLRAGGTGVVSL